MELGQLFFTSMPAKMSPIKKEGYHAHFWTEGFLSLGEVSEIEKKLIYDVSDKNNPVKKQYFFTQAGKIVVAETHFVNTEKGNEIDSFKRTESYFSHCYIVALKDFLTLNNNPFIVFSNLPFFSSLDALKKSGHPMHTYNVNAISARIEDRKDPSFTITEMSPMALYTLIGFADNASKHLKSKKQLQFVGDRPQFEKILMLIFKFLPPNLRFYCTFDTFHDKCNIPLGIFWAVSVQRRTMGDAFIPVDLQTAKIQAQEMQHGEFRNKYYGGWLKNLFENTKVFEDIDSKVVTAYYLADLTAGEQTTPPAMIDTPTVSSFFKMYENDINLQLSKILSRLVPFQVVKFFHTALLEYSPNSLATIELLVPAKITPHLLADLTLRTFSQNTQQFPNASELKAFHKLAIDTLNNTLLALCLIWMDNLKELTKTLSLMSPQEYQNLCTIALQREDVYAADLVVQQKVKILLDVDIRFEDDRDVIELIKATIQIGETSDLGLLNNKVNNLSKQSLLKIMRAVNDKDNIDPTFTARINLLYNQYNNS
jgi:hypothetical protein